MFTRFVSGIAQCLVVISLLASIVSTQIPNNSAIISRFRLDGALMPDGGLTVVDLDNPANTADVTGLGDDLAGPTWFSNYYIGANCVLFD